MNWIEVALIAAAIIGLVAGGILVARSPAFWFGMGVVMLKAGMPYLIRYVSKRMPPEEEAAMRRCVLSGGEWDPIRKRCKNR